MLHLAVKDSSLSWKGTIKPSVQDADESECICMGVLAGISFNGVRFILETDFQASYKMFRKQHINTASQ